MALNREVKNNSSDIIEIPKITFPNFLDLGEEFFQNEFLQGHKFTSVQLVAFYIASIRNKSIRKLLAPYFLPALNSCTPKEIADLVQRCRPIESSEVYQDVVHEGRRTKNIEVYVCYAFLTADIKLLKLDELGDVITFLNKHHPKSTNVINTLRIILTALQFGWNLRDRNPPLPLIWPLEMEYHKILDGGGSGCVKLTFAKLPENCYINLAGAKIGGLFSERHPLPAFANLENSILTCTFSGVTLSRVNFFNADLTNTGFSLTTFDEVDMRSAKSDERTFTSLAHTDQMHPYPECWGEDYTRANPAILRNLLVVEKRLLQSLIIDSQTLSARPFIMMMKSGALDLNRAVTLQIPLDLNSDNLEKELNSFHAIQQQLDPVKDSTVIIALNRLLANTLVIRLSELAEKGIEIQPLYCIAVAHPCFAYRPKVLFKSSEIIPSESQRLLTEGYENIIAGLSSKPTNT